MSLDVTGPKVRIFCSESSFSPHRKITFLRKKEMLLRNFLKLRIMSLSLHRIRTAFLSLRNYTFTRSYSTKKPKGFARS